MPLPKYRLPDIDDRHGQLTVYREARRNSKGTWLIQCRCVCGSLREVQLQHWVTGHTRSCGCIKNPVVNLGEWSFPKDPQRTGLRNQHRHGMSTSRIYHIWANMLARCTNPNNNSWDWYGGKGVQVCDDWTTFLGFAEWAYAHGYTDDLTIDRIESSGNYQPDNCQWIPLADNIRKRQVFTGTKSPVVDGQRKCQDCGLWKSAEEDFHIDNGDPAGIRRVCRSCVHDRDARRTDAKAGRPFTPRKPGNRVDAVMLTIFGETKNLSQWSRDPRCLVSRPTLDNRIRSGWSPERALSTRPR